MITNKNTPRLRTMGVKCMYIQSANNVKFNEELVNNSITYISVNKTNDYT